ncbi:MAG: hypothetical protein FJW40_24580 [Acidobacteria bacterium]|nr:hypothetical protein [Acidobacteriota bacterium]
MRKRLPIPGLLLGLTLHCAGQTTGPTIVATPATITFNYIIGAATLPAAQSVAVKSTPNGQNYSVSVTSSSYGGAWLLPSVVAGKAPSSIALQVNPTGLPVGSYSATVTITSTTGTSPPSSSVGVTLLVSAPAPTLTASPASLTFNYTTGGPIPHSSLTAPFILSSNGAPAAAAISITGATWLKVAPTGNVNVVGLLNTIGVTVDPTGLAPKVYTGTIKITSATAVNKTLNVAVTLNVNAALPKLGITWPSGIIKGSAATIFTLTGSNLFSTTTASTAGFSPQASITVTDAASATATEVLTIPIYAAAATGMRIGMSSLLPSVSVGASLSYPLSVSGGTAPYVWTVAGGALPPGISLSGGSLIGTPTTAGTYYFALGATDSSAAASYVYQHMKQVITPTGTSSLRVTGTAGVIPPATVGTAYSTTLTAAGGSPPYTWSATGLPTGLSISGGGVITGTPTTAGATAPVTASNVSDRAMLATLPATSLANAGVLRVSAITPAPGGGTSNDAQIQIFGGEPMVTAVVNAGSYKQGSLSPGEITTIFGQGLGPATLTIFDPTTPPIPTALPTTAPSTSVTIAGVAAPVIYTSATQVGVIVPYTISGSSIPVVVTYSGLASQPFTVAAAATSPGLFTVDSSGRGQAAILNYNPTTADYTINAPANPASKGSPVVIYLTGVGATTSGVANALIPASPAITATSTPNVTIGGQAATVDAHQAPPGSVPGLYQLNVTVPNTAPTGTAVPVVVTIAGVDSQANVTMAVR